MRPILLMLCIAQLGRAQVMVVRQPPPLDRSTVKPGAERGLIAATLGAPSASEADEEMQQTHDIR